MLVIVVIVFIDLVIVVVVGVIVFVLMFVWEYVKYIYVVSYINFDGYKEYYIYGFIFFGLVVNFFELFDVYYDFKEVIVDFVCLCVVDYLVIDVIEILVECYVVVGKILYLCYLS